MKTDEQLIEQAYVDWRMDKPHRPDGDDIWKAAVSWYRQTPSPEEVGLYEALRRLQREPELWKAPKPGAMGGCDQYAGMAPGHRMIDAALAAYEAKRKEGTK